MPADLGLDAEPFRLEPTAREQIKTDMIQPQLHSGTKWHLLLVVLLVMPPAAFLLAVLRSWHDSATIAFRHEVALVVC